MKVPPFMLTDTITVETYSGSGARGPMYETAASVKARVEYRRKVLESPTGDDVIAEARVLADAADEAKLSPGSRVTLPGGHKGQVLDRRVPTDLAGPVLVEALVS